MWQNINLKHSTMKKLYSTILMLVMLLLPIQMRAEGSAISVFTIEGKKMATLKDKDDAFSLGKGIYIINGKKVVVK